MGLTAVVAAGCLSLGAISPAAARHRHSSENAWRIGTYVGAAGTAAALATGRGTLGLIGAGATLLSYSQWRHQVRRRHQDESRYAYSRYRRAYYRRHRRR